MIVLDCSAGVALASNSPQGRSLESALLSGEPILAPELYLAEAANAAWKYLHAGLLQKPAAKQLYENAVAFVDTFIPMQDLMLESLALAARLDHSAYDMVYIVLARRNDAALCTLDKRLQTLCLKAGADLITPIDLDWNPLQK